MSTASLSVTDTVATVTLSRGKVNALDAALLEALHAQLTVLEGDPAVTAVILTGHGKFFSFGFDVPGLRGASRETFNTFVTRFSTLYRYMFLYPKPLIAALNGHAPAGGCILAIACDRRLAAQGARIGLNEISLGAALPAGSVEILKYWVGHRNADKLIVSGTLLSADEALEMGLADEICEPARLPQAAHALALQLGGKAGLAFATDKRLLREALMEEVARREPGAIRTFVDVWYSPLVQERLAKVVIV